MDKLSDELWAYERMEKFRLLPILVVLVCLAH
jgi:hypothetical protein